MTWEIRQGEAVEMMRAMRSASIDAVVTDPPYGERAAGWDSPRSEAWHELWIREAARLLVPEGPLVTFGSRRYLDVVMGAMRAVLGDTAARPLQTGAWVHRQGFPPADGFLRPEHEPFLVSGRLRVDAEDVRRCRPYGTDWDSKRPERRNVSKPKADKWGFKPTTFTPNVYGPMGGTIIESTRNLGDTREHHPTQKPAVVMDYLVCLACPPGGLVLDPFCGSGTSGLAALRHGRRFLGIELNPTYCQMARRRIAGPLFAGQPLDLVTEEGTR